MNVRMLSMNRMRRVGLLVGVAVLVGSVMPVEAEKIDMTQEELRRTATHIFTGRVITIHHRTEMKGSYSFTNYVAEVRVIKCEKGCGIQGIVSDLPRFEGGELIYIRYWQRHWTGEGRHPPSTAGHRGLPIEGEVCRVYLARNAYDGFTYDNKDGGFNVIGANGFEKVKLAEQE